MRHPALLLGIVSTVLGGMIVTALILGWLMYPFPLA